jgi:type I restriction enzyme S subunit
MDVIENAGNGSVFQEISKASFKALDFAIPPKEILKQFDEEMQSLFNKVKSNTIQIRTLTQLRDTLLPKLMSGEVKVE